MAKLLDGKLCARQVLEEIKARADAFALKHGRRPKLVVIMAGDDPASLAYVGNKEKACKRAGVETQTIFRGKDVTAASLTIMIDRFNRNDDIDGILLQLPLPDHLKPVTQMILDHISPEKDVDGLSSVSQGRLVTGAEGLRPCTPLGILELLKRNDIGVAGENVVIVGRSSLVGKPLAAMLTAEDATVTLCHSKTQPDALEEHITSAHIVVSAIGKPRYWWSWEIAHNAVLIDVGITRLRDGSLVGDFDEDCHEYSEAYTPVPGGVGQMTVAMLVSNTMKAAEVRNEKG